MFWLFCIYLAFICCGYASDVEKPKIKAKKVEFRKAENKVIFTGDVVITRSSDVLYADSAVNDEKENIIDAWGNVRGYFTIESTTTSRIKAGRVRWELNTGIVKLVESPEIVYLGSTTGEITAKSDLLTLMDESREAYFNGNVFIYYGKSIAESNVARYFHNDKKFELLKDEKKMPFVKYSGEHKIDFKAEKIDIFFDSKNMNLKKNVDCIIYQ